MSAVRIGDYEIEGELGAGGMATVYRARHVVLDTHHALKVLDPKYRSNADARTRFLDEAKIQAKHLDHPNIVKVTNIVATAEHAALVMELVDGVSLDGRLGDLKQDPAEIKRIMLAVLDAVGYAHAAGIIHRDLKPANVLLARQGDTLVPKVSDFGIAKVIAASPAGAKKKSTAADARMGTLTYMSPEQIRRSKDVTPRSDVFSLGAMLYEMATGDVPFGGESDYDVMENIMNGRYEPPARKYAKLDPIVASVIVKALQVDPANRFASCEEMATALRGGAATAPTEPTANERVSSRRDEPVVAPRRRIGLVGLAAVVLAIGGLALAVALRGGGQGRDTRIATVADARAADAMIDVDARVVDAVLSIDAPVVIQIPPPADLLHPADRNRDDVLQTTRGVTILTLVEGHGETPSPVSDAVRVRMTGWSKDGKTFLSGGEREVLLHHAITGIWDTFVYIKPGAKVRTWIPEEYGYRGNAGPAGDLVFEIEFLETIHTTREELCVAPFKPGLGYGSSEAPRNTQTSNDPCSTYQINPEWHFHGFVEHAHECFSCWDETTAPTCFSEAVTLMGYRTLGSTCGVVPFASGTSRTGFTIRIPIRAPPAKPGDYWFTRE